MNVTEGVFPALITPFDSDGNVDYDSLAENIDRIEDSGIAGLVPCGSTGESATLTYEEHKDIIDFTVENSSLPVIAGTGSNSTHEAIELTKHADKAGADAALLISPYYNIPNNNGLIEHYKQIADPVDIPIILYNVPGRTGQDIAEVVPELANHPNIAGLKEASGDIGQVSNLINKTKDEEFDVISGDDPMTLPIIELGGSGVISVAANLFPEKMTDMVEKAQNGNIEKARKIHYELLPLFNVLFIDTNPIPVKIAMEELGYASSSLRLPLNTEIKKQHKNKIKNIVRKIKD